MTRSLHLLFDSIAAPEGGESERPSYAVLPVRGCGNCFVGKDRESFPCLLVSTPDVSQRRPMPIRLENLDVHFGLPCTVRRPHDTERQGRFTVVRCRSVDGEIVRYFLSVCASVAPVLGERPTEQEVAAGIQRLVSIFRSAQTSSVQTANGLFGELYVIARSANPIRTLSAWRVDEAARFDFVVGDARLEVKTASGRVRAHVFSYEQCNPPPGTVAAVASMFVERASEGLTLRSLVGRIADLVASEVDLVLKLHEVVAGTLGRNLSEAMTCAYDERVTSASLEFFDLEEIPGIRGGLPMGVSDAHFRSDLSTTGAASTRALVEREAVYADLLPIT